jgi:hypothetical protein
MGQGDVVDTVHYVDTTEKPEPWPWIPRYWRASDVPEMKANIDVDPAVSPVQAVTKAKTPRKRATRNPKKP